MERQDFHHESFMIFCRRVFRFEIVKPHLFGQTILSPQLAQELHSRTAALQNQLDIVRKKARTRSDSNSVQERSDLKDSVAKLERQLEQARSIAEKERDKTRRRDKELEELVGRVRELEKLEQEHLRDFGGTGGRRGGGREALLGLSDAAAAERMVQSRLVSPAVGGSSPSYPRAAGSSPGLAGGNGNNTIKTATSSSSNVLDPSHHEADLHRLQQELEQTREQRTDSRNAKYAADRAAKKAREDLKSVEQEFEQYKAKVKKDAEAAEGRLRALQKHCARLEKTGLERGGEPRFVEIGGGRGGPGSAGLSAASSIGAGREAGVGGSRATGSSAEDGLRDVLSEFEAQNGGAGAWRRGASVGRARGTGSSGGGRRRDGLCRLWDTRRKNDSSPALSN